MAELHVSPPSRLTRATLLLVVAAAVVALPRATCIAEPPAMDGAGAPDAGMADAAMGEPAAPTLTTVTDAEAAPLLEGLKKAAKARNGSEVMPLFESLAGKTHKEFEPALAKLLSHLSADVAVRTATLIGERPGEKTGATLWKGWSHPINDKRYAVKGSILRAMGQVGARLDPKQYNEVEKLWNLSEDVGARNGFSDYFATIKDDKRPCKLLAIWIDQPQPTNVNDGNNPPREWWEARYKLWRETQANAVRALRAITGQQFSTTEDAKKWFAANPAFGFKW